MTESDDKTNPVTVAEVMSALRSLTEQCDAILRRLQTLETESATARTEIERIREEMSRCVQEGIEEACENMVLPVVNQAVFDSVQEASMKFLRDRKPTVRRQKRKTPAARPTADQLSKKEEHDIRQRVDERMKELAVSGVTVTSKLRADYEALERKTVLSNPARDGLRFAALTDERLAEAFPKMAAKKPEDFRRFKLYCCEFSSRKPGAYITWDELKEDCGISPSVMQRILVEAEHENADAYGKIGRVVHERKQKQLRAANKEAVKRGKRKASTHRLVYTAQADSFDDSRSLANSVYNGACGDNGYDPEDGE